MRRSPRARGVFSRIRQTASAVIRNHIVDEDDVVGPADYLAQLVHLEVTGLPGALSNASSGSGTSHLTNSRTVSERPRNTSIHSGSEPPTRYRRRPGARGRTGADEAAGRRCLRGAGIGRSRS